MASTHVVLGGAGGSGSGIDPAVITAKGDLIAGTGSGTYDNLAVGTNTHFLQADSTQTTGLKWAAVSAIDPATITTKGDLIAGTGAGTYARVAVGTNDYLLQADSTAAAGVSYVQATNTLVNSTIVKRDSSGSFRATDVQNSAGQRIWRCDAAAAYSAAGLLGWDFTGARPVLWQGFSFANSTLAPAVTLSTKSGGTTQVLTWATTAPFANATMCVSNTTSELQWFGARAPITSKTAAYTATESDGTILCDTTSAGFTVTLPAASGKAGMILMIKKISSDGNTLTVDGNASETIDGATTKTTTTQYAGWTIHCDGSNWHVIGTF